MLKNLLNKSSTLLIKSAFFLLYFFVIIQLIYPQDFQKNSETFFNLEDNHLNLSSILKDTIRIQKKDTTVIFQMKKSPWKAVLYSAILPGLGQFYNESYWKVPIVLTVGGYLGYVIVKNQNKFIDYRDKYALSQTRENPEGDLRLKNYREFYRDQRDQFLLYFAFFYLITLVDSYVDAHIYDFDVSEKVRFTISHQKNFIKLSFTF